MNGNILTFSIKENIGIISGDDGKRYKFYGKSWKEMSPIKSGLYVDFDIDQQQFAIDIFLYAPKANIVHSNNGSKNISCSIIALILAIISTLVIFFDDSLYSYEELINISMFPIISIILGIIALNKGLT